ncbi:MAG: metal ABC transporter permease [Alphaproteobacteria bacterium]|jgi:zinc transport system permease protein|nr:metal ABC transporter permease [Alphaproteobacteria bacterium]
MIEDFFSRAILAGLGLAMITGPLGCFLIWRRMAYFGAAVSHAGLLGVALGLLIGIDPTIGAGAVSLAMAMLLATLEHRRLLPTDTLMGVVAHSGLAIGLVVLASLQSVRVDLMAYLFGDILAVGIADIVAVFAGLIVTGLFLYWGWRPLLSATVHRDLAAAEGTHVTLSQFSLMVMIALTVAIGMKLVGILLIVSMLILPAAAARRLASSPEQMAVGATAIGAVSVIAGLFASASFDTPAGPSIVVVAALIFAIFYAMPLGKRA